MKRQTLDAIQSALNGGAVQPEALGKLAERGLRLPDTCRGDHPYHIRLLGQAAI
jgi:hypothetical protein